MDRPPERRGMRPDPELSADLAADARHSLFHVPEELRALSQWVRYQCFEADERGKRGKPPHHPTEDRRASCKNPEDWAPFVTALSNVGRHQTAGLSLAFAPEGGLVGIDLDGVVDAAGELTPFAERILEEFPTYAEYSPSQTGIHLIGRGKLRDGRGRKKKESGLELYDRDRFFTMTGWVFDETHTQLMDIQEALDRLIAREFPPVAPPVPRSSPSCVGWDSQSKDVVDRARAYLTRIPPAISGQGGHDQTFKAALSLVKGFALSVETALDLMQEWNIACEPPWSERELRHKVESAARVPKPEGYLLEDSRNFSSWKTKKGPGFPRRSPKEPPGPEAPVLPPSFGGKPDEVPPVPAVKVPGFHVDGEGEAHEVGCGLFCEAVLDAFPAGTLYRRSGLVGELRQALSGGQAFRIVHPNRLRVLVDDHVRLIQWKSKGDNSPAPHFRHCSPDWAGILLEHGLIHSKVRDLRILTTYPVFAGDFGLSVPGWNSESGVFYDQPETLADLRTDIPMAECREILQDLVIDFPFKEEGSRVNFFALLLTPLIRPALRGNTPLFMIQSSKPRTGKSMLAEQVLGGIIQGRPSWIFPFCPSEEEMEKRFHSCLQGDETIVHLDNLNHFLNSASLASILTAGEVGIRQFGTLQVLKVPNNITFVATGNNPRATEELVKRTVPIVLQPATADPEKRTDFFHEKLSNYVLEVRPRVLGALVSMVERWIQGGKEMDWRANLGGFNSWSQAVSGILVTAGFQGFLSNVDSWRAAADPGGVELRAFCRAWWETHQGREVSPKDLAVLAENLELLRDVLKSPHERGKETALGRFLRAHNDTPVADLIDPEDEGSGYQPQQWVIKTSRTGNNNKYYLQELRSETDAAE